MKSLSCQDLGIPDCGYAAKGETVEDVRAIMFEHASLEHPDFIERTVATTLEDAEAAEAAVLAAIKDVEGTTEQ